MTYTYQIQADLLTRADVVVCGGGTAGVHAAIAAAREGQDTVLIETFGALGGSSTMALVAPNMSTGVRGEPANSYLTKELDRRAEESNIMKRSGRAAFFDPLLLRCLLEKMAAESGVRIYLYTTLLGAVKDGNRIKGVFVRDKAGVHVIEGKMFIDCTGDGDLSVMAGASYTSGHPETGKNQPISLRYMVSGVDMKAFHETAPDSISLSPQNCAYASCVVQRGSRSVEKIMTAAMDAHDLTPEDLAYWQVFTVPTRPDTLACNCPEFFEQVDGTAPADLTHAQLEGKQAILRHLAFYKKYFRGFENAYISEIAPMVGVRESREIETMQILTLSDAASYRKFPDAVAQTNYPIDVHGFGDSYSNKRAGKGPSDKPYFEIPYGSLVVRGLDNLLVAGRCIGCDFFAEAAVRIMPTCRATGEAAGLAAALCLADGILPRALDGQRLHDAMCARGADFI